MPHRAEIVTPALEKGLKDLKEIRAGEAVFTRDDAIRLARDWQEYAYSTKPGRHVADNVENMIEELCLAWGFTVAEVRETWWKRQQCAGKHDWKVGSTRGPMCGNCGALKSEYEKTVG